MEEFDSGAHASYSLFYHMVWAPKYRRRVLDGKVGERAKQVIMEASEVWLQDRYLEGLARSHTPLGFVASEDKRG